MKKDDSSSQHGERSGQQQLQVLATKTVVMSDNLYQVVDFLNKTLKDSHLIFGLTKNGKDQSMTITIYQV